jgi:hypothetical protein
MKKQKNAGKSKTVLAALTGIAVLFALQFDGMALTGEWSGDTTRQNAGVLGTTTVTLETNPSNAKFERLTNEGGDVVPKSNKTAKTLTVRSDKPSKGSKCTLIGTISPPDGPAYANEKALGTEYVIWFVKFDKP